MNAASDDFDDFYVQKSPRFFFSFQKTKVHIPHCAHMMRYAEDHVDFIQSFLAYLVCITAWFDKASKIMDIFEE